MLRAVFGLDAVRSGRVKVPGFYDDVRPLSDEERAAWQALPFNEKKFRKDIGAPKLYGEKGFTTLERLWARWMGGEEGTA